VLCIHSVKVIVDGVRLWNFSVFLFVSPPGKMTSSRTLYKLSYYLMLNGGSQSLITLQIFFSYKRILKEPSAYKED
jgi:hypothetical protein